MGASNVLLQSVTEVSLYALARTVELSKPKSLYTDRQRGIDTQTVTHVTHKHRQTDRETYRLETETQRLETETERHIGAEGFL